MRQDGRADCCTSTAILQTRSNSFTLQTLQPFQNKQMAGCPQQVLKIKIAYVVRSDRYVALDAKNHLVSALTREFLESSTVNLRTNGYSYVDQPMLEYLERTLDYLGL